MALLKNVEVYFARLDPDNPDARHDPDNPTWNLQLRTTDQEQRKAWVGMGLRTKILVGPPGAENEGEPILSDGKKVYYVNLRKRKYRQNGKENAPVRVLDGQHRPVDPKSIGNGSIVHVRIDQYASRKEPGKMISVLEDVVLVRHVVYMPRDNELTELEKFDTETVLPEDRQEKAEEQTEAKTGKPKTPAVSPKPKKKDDEVDESAADSDDHHDDDDDDDIVY